MNPTIRHPHPSFLTVVALALAAASLTAVSARADVFGSGTSAFTLSFVDIGNAGNAAEPNFGRGSVPYIYRISAYEISQSNIDSATASGLANVTAGRWTNDQPAANITWYEAAAFVNWLNSNLGYQPAYNLTFSGSWTMSLWSAPNAWTLGGTNSFRHKDAGYFLPSENEWFKAAYYNPAGSNYYSYPTASSTAPDVVNGGTAAGSAVYNGRPSPASVNNAGGLSPYGTMAQGGNIAEMLETAFDGTNNDPTESRTFKGGNYADPNNALFYPARNSVRPQDESSGLGFRVASVVPEPSTFAMSLAGVACGGYSMWRRRKRS